MLVLPLKAGTRYDVGSALATWLDEQQDEAGGCLSRAEALRLSSLRNALTDVFLKPNSHKVALEASQDIHEYHAVLLQLQHDYNIVVVGGDQQLRLTWRGALDEKLETHGTLQWDRAAVLFNAAALCTDQAADCSVNDREACKQAVGYCQTAATLLQEIPTVLTGINDVATVDYSHAMLNFWQSYLLAQAQYFIYRMASNNTTANNHGTLALLAQASYQLFNQALTASQEPRLHEIETQTDWGAYCKAISMLQASRAAYHQAVVHRLAHEHGPELYRLREARTKVLACLEFVKSLSSVDGVTSYTRRECLAMVPVVQDRLAEAETDNYKIYQEMIPNTMPEIPSKQLAKTVELPGTLVTPKQPITLLPKDELLPPPPSYEELLPPAYEDLGPPPPSYGDF